MKIDDIIHLKDHGFALITDFVIPELDWNNHRGTKQITVSGSNGKWELTVKSVELTFKNGNDHLSYIIVGNLDEKTITELLHGKVEQLTGGDRPR